MCIKSERELFKGKASIFTLEGPSNLCTPTQVTQKQVVGTVGTGVGQEGSGGHRWNGHEHTSLQHPLVSSRVDQCYAALGMLDYLHGTDTVLKQIKAYKRHMILLGFTPVSESIPDPPKMMD